MIRTTGAPCCTLGEVENSGADPIIYENCSQVRTWQSGFLPLAMDFSRGDARYNPEGETAADEDILRRQECDAALVIASYPDAHFPVSSMKYYAQIPTIRIDPHETPTTDIVGVEEVLKKVKEIRAEKNGQ